VDKHRAANKGKAEYALPAFELAGGLDALLEVYLFALGSGSNEARESAAQGLGEVVDMTSAGALKPYVVKMAGPLIRIVGDRFPGSVKAAILDALKKLLARGGPVLRPFLPQLQTTFVKSLQNALDAVRVAGMAALEEMVPLLPRLDPLVQEFVQGAASPDAGVRQDMLRGLLFVLLRRGKDVSPAAVLKACERGGAVFAAVRDYEQAGVRVVGAAAEAAALRLSGQDFYAERLGEADVDGADWPTRHGTLLALDAGLRCGLAMHGLAVDRVLERALEDESASVRAVAVDACGWVVPKRLDLLSEAARNEDSSGVRAVAQRAMGDRPVGIDALASMFSELGGVF
jgi:hypothetical protein